MLLPLSKLRNHTQFCADLGEQVTCRCSSTSSCTKAPNPNPMIVTSEWIGQSSEQISDYVFCGNCEQIFNESGERWVIAHLAREQGSPLYETLEKHKPFFQDKDFSTYAGTDIAAIDVNKIVHFALGLFWRASVHSWRTKGRRIRIDLGRYGEPIRQFILGIGPFPARVFLSVCVVPPRVPLLSAVAPFQTPERQFHMFSFYVPGVEFVLNVGKQVPDFIRAGCFATSPSRPIFSSPEFASFLGQNYRKALSTARYSDKFAEHLRKRGRL